MGLDQQAVRCRADRASLGALPVGEVVVKNPAHRFAQTACLDERGWPFWILGASMHRRRSRGWVLAAIGTGRWARLLGLARAP